MHQTWKKALKTALLAAAAVAVSAGTAAAQPANCRDVNNDGSVNATDGTALENRLVNPSFVICGGPTAANIDCADINDNGTIDTGDRVLLAKSLAGEDLLYTACTGPAAVTCPSTFSGNITTNTHWGPASCQVDLAGDVLVVAPAVLTIDPGVVVRGVVNPSDPAALIITRGAKLDANGTAADPIVFTSANAPGARAAANWGGVVLNGTAPVNFDGGVGSAEGLPPGLALYGGSDVNDNSGRVRFARIEYSGIEFSPDNELNVFTMNAVGNGTIVDHVQANRGNDDCHEWFGGTVKAKYLVASGCRDDDFDWQIGFRGAVQFGLSHKEPTILDGSGRNGIEADNNEFGFDNLPRSNPNMCNVTLIGAKGAAAISGSGANLRRGTAGLVSNGLFLNWQSACLDLDDAQTLARACTDATTLRTGADVLRVQDSICFNNGGATQVSGTATSPACTAAQAWGLWGATEGLVPSTPTGAVADPAIPASASYPTSFGTADYRPSSALPAPDCEAIDPAFFDSAPYVGAFQSGGTNWLLDSAACVPGQVDDCWLSADIQ